MFPSTAATAAIYGNTLGARATGDYSPSLRSPWLAALESAPLVIVYQTQEKKPDSVYGEGIDRTWKRLNARPATVDFGISAMENLLAQKAPPEETEPDAPALLPAHMDMLSRTSVRHGIDVAPWLHGWESGPADVYL